MRAMASEEGHTAFIDRQAEKKLVYDFCKGRLGKETRCLIFRTMRDVGTTCFLDHLKNRHRADWFTVYADCQSSDPESIFSNFFAEVEQQPFLRWLIYSPMKEIGKLLFQVVGALLSYVPLWGRPAATAVGVSIPQMAFTPYPSISSQRFAELITSGRWKRPIVFLVDNVQEIKPQSLNIFKTVFSDKYEHVKFILCYVEDKDAQDTTVHDFVRRLNAMGLLVEVTNFPPPSDHFLEQLLQYRGLDLSQRERRSILEQSGQSVSKLITALMHSSKQQEKDLSTAEIEILRYLLIANQPLLVSDLHVLFMLSPRINITHAEINKALNDLTISGWLHSWKNIFRNEVELSSGKSGRVKKILNESSINLVATQEIYRYFCNIQKNRSERHAPTAYGSLLYKLAKQIDHQSLPMRALDLVRISLGQADGDAARSYLEEAVGEIGTRTTADLYTLLAFHIYVQEYEEALLVLDKMGPSYWMQFRFLRIIHAVVNNRLRHHDKASQEIDILLADTQTSPEELALLLSYKISGLMHDGRLQEASAEFDHNYDKFRNATNRGYALRNCAAIYFWEPTKDVVRAAAMLDDASKVFRQQNDSFGYLTTLNNRGALIECTTQKRDAAKLALPLFEEAFHGLSIYGIQHIEEAGANLGICLLLTGQIESAANHLRKMISIVPFDFPRILMESALSFAEAILGDHNAARQRMAELIANVGNIALPEAVYHASVNAAAIELMDGVSTLRFEYYIKTAQESNFWGGIETLDLLRTAKTKGAVTKSSLLTLFSSDFLQYWSQNPLVVLSPSGLSSEAESNNMVH